MRIRLLFALSVILLFINCTPKNMKVSDSKEHAYTNNLINETSPYLLQHAHNPVDWNPWGPEALQRAKEENKLLIISIGYSACHWCHVMEHESFEDSIVAKLMNENFIPIKVDREERPDVDDVYMSACQLVSGRGGWPLNAFALPDGRPIWAGTYFPRDKWIDILKQFSRINKENPEKLEESAEQLTQQIRQQSNVLGINTEDTDFSTTDLDIIGQDFIKQIDLVEGGRRGAPKFPMPNNYEFLLKYHSLSGNQTALEAANTTLTKMAFGGIYDQIGGGFARYSTDKYWKAPHFEKMLYDNGQLISLYSEAYSLTKDPLYKHVVNQTLTFIKRELTSPEYGFYSSLDADSEGEEGKFYVWTYDELKAALPDSSLFDLAIKYYNVEKHGNWESGNNILLRKITDKSFIALNHLDKESFEQNIAHINKLLLASRSSKIRPGLDDKILTSWNALMLKGYVDAYRAFQDEEYLSTALKNANFLIEHQIQSDYRINRNYKEGRSSINGFLDDYSLVIDAFISLYQVTFDEKWLNEANSLAEYTIEHFYNKSNGLFNYTSSLDPPLISRSMELNDNVIPGSNSVMARDLKYLGELLFNEKYLEMSRQMLQNIAPSILSQHQPSFYSNWCQLYLDMAYPPYEVAIVGPASSALRNEMMSEFLPNVIYLGGESEGSLQLLQNKLSKDETLIYVCQNKACKFPVKTAAEAIELIQK